MKINYKNTALALIDDPLHYSFAFPPNMYSSDKEIKEEELKDLGKRILKNGSTLSAIVGNNIRYVSETFWDAYLKGKHKLKQILDKEDIEESGVLILGGYNASFTHTYFYYIKTQGKGEEWDYDLLFMDFSKYSKNPEAHLDVHITRQLKENKYVSLIWKQYLDDGLDHHYWESLIIGFILFKKYCDIETKVIEPKKKAKVADKKYINETNNRITVLDSTWFTNLVVSGAFEVSGHLHWYYYGPNKSLKKLQWVNTYEKQGYTRKAKALTQNTKE